MDRVVGLSREVEMAGVRTEGKVGSAGMSLKSAVGFTTDRHYFIVIG